METLRCVVCQGQSIADSDASMAGDMRALVRSRIAAGETPQAIRAWLIERYGDYNSYDPPLGRGDGPAMGGAVGPARHRHRHRAVELPAQEARLMGWIALS